MGAWSSGEGPILVADCDRRFRRAASRALVSGGFEVREAGSGEEALRIVATEEIALVLMEVRLPDVSGYEVCRKLRDERGDELPIVFVSGDRTDPSDRVAGLLVGADDYLAKPLAPDELVARVRRHVQRAAGRTSSREARLTAREQQVLGLLARGLGTGEVGLELSISPKTVSTHVEHIYTKLGVHTRAQAVASAFRLELVE